MYIKRAIEDQMRGLLDRPEIIAHVVDSRATRHFDEL